MKSRQPRYVETFSGKLFHDETSVRITIKSIMQYDRPYMFIALTPHSVWALDKMCHDEQIPARKCELEDIFKLDRNKIAIVQCKMFGLLAFPIKYASKAIESYARWLAYNDYWYQMAIIQGSIEDDYNRVMEKLWKLEDEGKLPTIYDALLRASKNDGIRR